MKRQMTSGETLREFCHVWFVQRDTERTLAFLTEDVGFMGTGTDEMASGRQQMAVYLAQDVREIPRPFECELSPIYEQPMAGGIHNVSADLTLKNSKYTWYLGTFFTLVLSGKEWLVKSLHVAEPANSQKDAEHYPGTLVMERTSRLRQELLNNSLPGDMIGEYIEDGFPFCSINHRTLEYLGYENETEFVSNIGGMITDYMRPDDRSRVDQLMACQLQRSEEYVVEYRVRKKDGSYIQVHDLGRRVASEDNHPAIMSVYMDITEEKQVRDRIKEMYEEELSYLAEQSSADGSIQGSPNITAGCLESYLSATDTSIAKVGDAYEDTIENLAVSAVDPIYGGGIHHYLNRERVLADYTVDRMDYHSEFLRGNSSSIIFWGSTITHSCQSPETGHVILFFYTQDVTKERMQKQLFKRIVGLDCEGMTEMDILQGMAYRIISVDESSMGTTLPDHSRFQSEIHATSGHYMDGAAKEKYLCKLDYDYMKLQLVHNSAYTFVVEMQDMTGMTQVKRSRVFYINRELKRVCVVRTDATNVVLKEQGQKKELAAALVAAEQTNTTKSDFLSRMSHEIRTLMNAIIDMNTITAQSIGDDEQVEGCVSKIDISSRFLLSLINDILDMSRIESSRMLLKSERIPTEELINGINSTCYSQADVRRVEYECIVGPVLDDYYIGNTMKLQQVLVNILSNAIKFTQKGDKVTSSVSQHGKTKNDTSLRFIVNDTGVGMNEEFLPYLLEPFSQESTRTTSLYGGTGLGLATSKNVVDMMDGKITARSVRGIGTKFTVDVRLGITEEEKLRHNQKKQDCNFSHPKTLAVDDDIAVCKSVVMTPYEMEIKAEWVDSNRKTINQVKKLWDGGRYLDMILIDWKILGMDGVETARRIRGMVGAEVTIVIMTAYDWISIKHEARLAGINLLMSKPIFKSSLVLASSRALGEKEQQAQQPEIDDYDLTGRHVLLVGDSQTNTEVAMMFLESKGFKVDAAENGLHALELFSKSNKGYYDAILMGIRMPLMDGLAAATSIRHLNNANSGTVPIIAMTANAFNDDIEKSKTAGMNAHLTRPTEPERIYQALYDFVYGEEA